MVTAVYKILYIIFWRHCKDLTTSPPAPFIFCLVSVGNKVLDVELLKYKLLELISLFVCYYLNGLVLPNLHYHLETLRRSFSYLDNCDQEPLLVLFMHCPADWSNGPAQCVEVLPGPFSAVHLVVKLLRHDAFCVCVVQVSEVHCKITEHNLSIGQCIMAAKQKAKRTSHNRNEPGLKLLKTQQTGKTEKV